MPSKPTLLLPILLTVAACCPPPIPPSAQVESHGPDPNGPLIIVGDTQRTTTIELFACRRQNEEERLALVRKMALDVAPSFVVHLGDMVSYGSSACEWKYFDELFSPFTRRGVAIHPVVGNHDYWGSDAEALAHARSRFRELTPTTYYALAYGKLAFVFLDSNLSGAEATAQADWLEREVGKMRAEVRGFVFFSHHPPYTLGEGRASERYQDRRVLDLFFRTDKAKLFMSGHVHGYERFAMRDRTFVVSGGGGGPRVEFRAPDEAKLQDPELSATFRGSTDERPFHYVVLTPSPGGLSGTVTCLAGLGCPADGELDHFNVSLAD